MAYTNHVRVEQLQTMSIQEISFNCFTYTLTPKEKKNEESMWNQMIKKTAQIKVSKIHHQLSDTAA
jgi:hypothetical protein